MLANILTESLQGQRLRMLFDVLLGITTYLCMLRASYPSYLLFIMIKGCVEDSRKLIIANHRIYVT